MYIIKIYEYIIKIYVKYIIYKLYILKNQYELYYMYLLNIFIWDVHHLQILFQSTVRKHTHALEVTNSNFKNK